MSNLQLILIVLMVGGVVWELILGVTACVIIAKGGRITELGFGPLLVAAIAFVAFLFTR